MKDDIKVNGYQYAVIPEWVLSSAISDRAIRLFAVLARYVGTHEAAWPSRKTLGEKINCSVSSVDRAVVELESIGAVKTEERRRENGSKTSSYFYLWPNITRDVDTALTSPVKVPPLTGDGTLPSRVIAPEGTLIEGTTVNSSTSTGVDAPPPSRAKIDYDKQFNELWMVYPRGVNKKVAYDKFKARIRAGDVFENILEAAEAYALKCKSEGTEEQFIQHLSTFLAKDRWKEYLPVPERMDCDTIFSAMAYDAYDRDKPWYDSKEGNDTFDNPSVRGYNRPRNSEGQMIDAEGKPYKLDAQGVRRYLD